MPDEGDYALMVRERDLEAARSAVMGESSHEFTIVYVSGGLIQSASFAGRGGECVGHMQEMLGIDFKNGRWARGHDERSVKASDGEMEQVLIEVFRTRAAEIAAARQAEAEAAKSQSS